MDMECYFNNIDKKIDQMTDNEFIDLLNKSGLEKCPYLEDFNKLCIQAGLSIKEDEDVQEKKNLINMLITYSKYPKWGNYDINPEVFDPDIIKLIQEMNEEDDE